MRPINRYRRRADVYYRYIHVAWPPYVHVEAYVPDVPWYGYLYPKRSIWLYRSSLRSDCSLRILVRIHDGDGIVLSFSEYVLLRFSFCLSISYTRDGLHKN